MQEKGFRGLKTLTTHDYAQISHARTEWHIHSKNSTEVQNLYKHHRSSVAKTRIIKRKENKKLHQVKKIFKMLTAMIFKGSYRAEAGGVVIN